MEVLVMALQTQLSYNQRISILKADKLKDKDGYPIPVAEAPVIYKCWASVNNLYGKELYEAMGVEMQDILNVRVRYCKQLEQIFLESNIKNRDYKIKFRNNIYDILMVDFNNFDKINITFKVQKYE